MQESHYESRTSDPAPKGAAAVVALLVRWVGAIMSVGLVLGIVYWAYSLGQRDALEVPVIRAMAGDARITPDDPGGAQADHQGLAVNEVLADATPEVINANATLAPEPQSVASEDESMAVLETIPPEPAPEPAPDTEPAQESAQEPMRVDASVVLTEILPDEPEPQPQSEVDNVPRTTVDGTVVPERRPDSFSPPRSESDVISDEIEGLLQEILPEEGDRSDFVPEPARPDPLFGNPALDPGEVLVQLGAYNSLEDAQNAWVHFKSDHRDLLAGLQRFIAPVEAGGRVLYQLRAAGFNDLNETQSLCTTLGARGVDCYAVTVQ
ncbi:MAG: SPOR domain-containing protein [Paracoccaceae bacterium]